MQSNINSKNYMFNKGWVPKELRSDERKVLRKKNNEDNFDKQMDKVDFTERKEILQNNSKIKGKKNIPLVLTYNNASKHISLMLYASGEY